MKSSQLAYPLGYMLPSAANFVITIWLTNYFSREDFGNFSIYKASVFTLWPFIGMSTHFYLQSMFHQDDRVDYRSRVFSSISLNFILFVLVEVICIIFHESISLFLGLESIWIFSIPLIALVLCLSLIHI